MTARRRYISVKPNENDGLEIPGLDLEVTLLDGWVRYWFRGELMPLPADLQRDLDETRQRLEVSERQREQAERLRDEVLGELDRERNARLALEQELERLRGRSS
jgi:hypothetical protein